MRILPLKEGDFLNTGKKERNKIRRMVLTALFTAMAYAVTFLFHIKVSFLTFDAKDTVICISAMLMGPAASTVAAFAVSLIEFLTVSDTGFWGFLMNFISSAAFSGIAGLIYRNERKLWGAACGLAAAIAAGTVVMLLLDMLVIPIYNPGVTAGTVAGMIPALLLPFNIVKYTLNAALVLALYKPISSALKRSGMLPASGIENNEKYKFGIRSVIVFAVAAAVCAACVCVLIFVFHGTFGRG